MRIYKLISKTKFLILWLMMGLSLATLLIFPTECRNGAANGVFLCIQVLIPSLFPFMILSAFIALSGIASKCPEVLTRISKRIFGLSGCALYGIFLSLIGGYPVGASSIKSLHKEKLISDSDAQRMALFCVASGPGFLVTYIGAAMTRNLRMGYILLLSQTLSLLILGIISKHTIKEKTLDSYCKAQKQSMKTKDAFILSIESAIRSSGKMCAFVIIFGAVSEVYISLCNGNRELLWLTALLEITNGIKIIVDTYPTVLISAVCGFGGLSVHFQIFSLLDGIDFSKSLFYIFRFMQGILNALITYILVKIFPLTQSVFSTVNVTETKLFTSVIGCVALIIVCVVFIISVKNKEYAKYKS